jgi:hypothetical protein
MSEIKGLGFIILALIVGASGLGLGAFTIISVQTGALNGDDGVPGTDGTPGVNGTDGQDAPGYYCSSGSELQAAIDTIGSGTGRIFITDDITLSATIDVDGGGSYIIQGTGLITVECDVDQVAFNIIDTESCIIRDLIINASKIITPLVSAIHIEENNSNLVTIDNLRLFDETGEANGITIFSDNVVISNSYINGMEIGISVFNGDESHIYNNKIINSGDSGIKMEESYYNLIHNNYIEGGDIGIKIFDGAWYNLISYNVIKEFNRYGVSCGWVSWYNEIVGNHISDSNSSADFFNRMGIHISGEYNEVIGNSCFNSKNPQGPPYEGLGILLDSFSLGNIIAGNTCIDNDINLLNLGTNNTLFGNNAP